MINRKCNKKSNGYMPIEDVLCNDDKLHVPLGTPINKTNRVPANAEILFGFLCINRLSQNSLIKKLTLFYFGSIIFTMEFGFLEGIL